MTHDDETVERVARAIAEEMDLDADDYYARKLARTALSAMPHAALLREALKALEPFAKGADRHDETVEHTEQERHYLPYGLQQIDLRRARAAAGKIRAALEHQQKGEPKP